jgi:hypothetical protein
MSKLALRTFYLFFAVLGLYWTFEAAGTVEIGKVAVQFTLVPLALAFFNVTFVKGEQNHKVTAIGVGLVGLAFASAGFGFWAMGQIGGVVAGAVGFVLIVCSIGRLHQLLRPTN